jgi:membrane-associated phospholipid phosphatase
MLHSSHTTRLVALSCVLAAHAVVSAGPAFAQRSAGSLRTITVSDTANGQQTLFTRRDAIIAAGFAGLTLAMLPLDQRIAARLQEPVRQNQPAINNAATGFEYVSSPGAYFIGAGLYAIGTVGGYRNVQDIGWHGAEAVILSSVIANSVKRLAGRARPYLAFETDSSSSDFRFRSGFEGGARQSFPSGHTTTAFAAAAAVTSEMRRHNPRSVWYVAPVMYGGATVVGLSRMYHNKHWASDVAIGAAIGTFTGLKVVRYSHAHPHNFIDRYVLPNSVLPNFDGGATLAWAIPIP